MTTPYDEAFQRQVLIPLSDERSKLPDSKPPANVALAGELGDSIREFVRWLGIKLPAVELAPMLQRFGDKLVTLGEIQCARDVFFTSAMNTARAHSSAKGVSFESEASGRWTVVVEVQTVIAVAKCDVATVISLDPRVKFPRTARRLRSALQAMQGGMSMLLHGLAPQAHESVAWLLLNGCREVFAVCEPLVVLGHANVATEFLTWCALTMEAVVTLSATRHLAWRMRLYGAIAYAYEDLGKLKGCRNLVSHARHQVLKLRRLEELDPPLPPRVDVLLKRAEADVALLAFKYETALDLTSVLPPLPTAEAEFQQWGIVPADPSAEEAAGGSRPPSRGGKDKGGDKGKGGGAAAAAAAAAAADPQGNGDADGSSPLTAEQLAEEAAAAAAKTRLKRCRALGVALLRHMASPSSELGLKSRHSRWLALCESLAVASAPDARPLREGFGVGGAGATAAFSSNEDQKNPSVVDSVVAENSLYSPGPPPGQKKQPPQVEDLASARRRTLAFAALSMLLPPPPLPPSASEKENAEDTDPPLEGEKEGKGVGEKFAEGETEAGNGQKAAESVEPVFGSPGSSRLDVRPSELLVVLLELVRLREFRQAYRLLVFAHRWMDVAATALNNSGDNNFGGDNGGGGGSGGGDNFGTLALGGATTMEMEATLVQQPHHHQRRPGTAMSSSHVRLLFSLPVKGPTMTDNGKNDSSSGGDGGNRNGRNNKNTHVKEQNRLNEEREFELMAQQLELVEALLRIQLWQTFDDKRPLNSDDADEWCASDIAGGGKGLNGAGGGGGGVSGAADIAVFDHDSDPVAAAQAAAALGALGGLSFEEEPFGEHEDERSSDNDDDNEADVFWADGGEEEGGRLGGGSERWTLFDDISPSVCHFGAPSPSSDGHGHGGGGSDSFSSLQAVPVAYALQLADVLDRATLVGPGDDASGAGAWSSFPSASAAKAEPWSLASHSADLLADAAYFMWHRVSLPLLEQLDQSAASNPLGAVVSPAAAAAAVNKKNSAMANTTPASAPLVLANLSALGGSKSHSLGDNRSGQDKNGRPRSVGFGSVEEEGRGVSRHGSDAPSMTSMASGADAAHASSDVAVGDPLDVALLVRSLLSVRAALSASKADDPVLSATVSLRLALILGEPSLGDDLRRGVQVCRLALTEMDNGRALATAPGAHEPSSGGDLTSLSRASVTCHVTDQDTTAATAASATAGSGAAATGAAASPTSATAWGPPKAPVAARPARPGAAGSNGDGVFGAACALDPLHQSLAALHVDLTAILFRLELRLAASLAGNAEAQAARMESAKIRAAQKAAGGGQASAAGVKKAGKGGGKGGGGGSSKLVSKAMSSTGGGGAVSVMGGTQGGLGAPSMKDGGGGGGPAGGLGLDGLNFAQGQEEAEYVDPLQVEPVCPSLVAAAENRASAEVRKNSAARALLLVEMATLRARMSMPPTPSPAMLLDGAEGASFPSAPEPPHRFSPLGAEVGRLLGEALSCLQEAGRKEEALLGQLVTWNDWGHPGNNNNNKARGTHEHEEEGGEDKNDDASLSSAAGAAEAAIVASSSSSVVPPPPLLVARSDGSATLQPQRWFPAPDPSRTPKKRGGGCGGSSHSTGGGGSLSGSPPQAQPVAYLRLFGKSAGAGADAVTVNNFELSGTGMVVPYDASSGLSPCVEVRDLEPNESYIFAVAAYTAEGSLVGGKIGLTTPVAVEALNPLPLQLCFGYLASAALGLGCESVARAAAMAVIDGLCSSKHRKWALLVKPPLAGQPEGHELGGTSGSVPGQHASPLTNHVGAALVLKPNELARAPRTTLHALAEALFVAAECARRLEPSLLADGNADGGTLAHLPPSATSAAAAVTSWVGQQPTLGLASGAGASSSSAQQAALLQLQRLGLCAELAVYLGDHALLQRSCHLAYNLCLRPLLSLARRATSAPSEISSAAPFHADGGLWRHLWAPLTKLHQSLAIVPTEKRTRTDVKLRVLLAVALADAGVAIGEASAVHKALCQGSIFPIPAPPPQPLSPARPPAEESAASPKGKGGKGGKAPAKGKGKDDAAAAEAAAAAAEAEAAAAAAVAAAAAAALPPPSLGPPPAPTTAHVQRAVFEQWQVSSALGGTMQANPQHLRLITGLAVPKSDDLVSVDSLLANLDGTSSNNADGAADGSGGGPPDNAASAAGGGSRPATAKSCVGEADNGGGGNGSVSLAVPVAPVHLSEAVFSELVLGTARRDLDRAWSLLQHRRLKGHPSWGRYACVVLEMVLERCPGGAAGRVVTLFMRAMQQQQGLLLSAVDGLGVPGGVLSFEDLLPLTMKTLEFEAKQDHRRFLMATAGVFTSPETALPSYIDLPLPPPPPTPPPPIHDPEESLLEGGGEEAGGGGIGAGGGGDGGGGGSAGGSRKGDGGGGGAGEGEGLAAGSSVAFIGSGLLVGGGGVGSEDEDGDKGSDAGGNTDDGGGEEEDESDDLGSEGESLIEEQLRGRPKDRRTKHDMFMDMITNPTHAEKTQLLWLGRLEVLLGLAEADVLLSHPKGCAKLKELAKLSGWAADGPMTELRLFLDHISMEPPPVLVIPLPPPPPSSSPSEEEDGGEQHGDGSEDAALLEDGEAAAAAAAAAAGALAVAGGEEGEGKEEGDEGVRRRPPTPPPPLPRRLSPRYNSTAGDVCGPLRDLIDHFASGIIRYRTGRAWRSLLSAVSELWSVCTSLWLSPFAYEPHALERLCLNQTEGEEEEKENDAERACLGAFGTLPAEPWDMIAHAFLDFLEMKAVLPKPPVLDDEDEDEDEDMGMFHDEDDDEEEEVDEQSHRGSVRSLDADDIEGDKAHTGFFLGGGGGCVGASGNSSGGAHGGAHHHGGGHHGHSDEGKVKVDLEWASRVVTFAMACLTMGRQWGSVVVLGRRLNELLLNHPTASEAAYPLMLHAQKAIVSSAHVEATRYEGLWAEHHALVVALEEKLLKKRRHRNPANAATSSRLHKGPAVKSGEEVELETVGAPLKVQLSNARAKLQVAEYALRWYQNMEQAYRKGKPQALDAVHVCRDLLLQSCHGDGIHGSVDSGATEPQQVAAIYSRACKVLRDKRETGLLQQALNELGDLQLTFQQRGNAAAGAAVGGAGSGVRPDFEKSWKGSIDALFSTLDADEHWEGLYNGAYLGAGSSVSGRGGGGGGATTQTSLSLGNDNAVESFALPGALATRHGLLPCLLAATTLGKLSRFASHGDRRRRLSLSLMAVPLWRAPLSLSLAHPARLCDYALYVPSPAAVFGGVEPFSNPQRLSIDACVSSLEHCCRTLVTQGEGLHALPLLALLEGLASKVCLCVRTTLRARLLKVDCLRSCGLVGQACSVLASVLAGAHLPKVKGGYAGLKTTTAGMGNRKRKGRKQQQQQQLQRASSSESGKGGADDDDDDDHGRSVVDAEISLVERNEDNTPKAFNLSTSSSDVALSGLAVSDAKYVPPYPPKRRKSSGASSKENQHKPELTAAELLRGGRASNETTEKEERGKEGKDGDPFTRPGLPFYGFAPFLAHLAPDHPANAPALEWLSKTGLDKGGDPAKAVAEAEAAAAAKAPAKGGKGKPKKGAPAPAAAAAAGGGAVALTPEEEAAKVEAKRKMRQEATNAPPSVILAGASDVVPWAAEGLGCAGMRALALSRGRLLLAIASPSRGLGCAFDGDDGGGKLPADAGGVGGDASPVSGGGKGAQAAAVDPLATTPPLPSLPPPSSLQVVMGQLRSAANDMAKAVAVECLQRAFVAYRLGCNADNDDDDLTRAMLHEEEEEAAKLAAAEAMAAAVVSSGGEQGDVSSQKGADAKASNAWLTLAKTSVSPTLLRPLVDALTLQAHVALADSKLRQARMSAAAAATILQQQAKLAAEGGGGGGTSTQGGGASKEEEDGDERRQRLASTTQRGVAFDVTTMVGEGHADEEEEGEKRSKDEKTDETKAGEKSSSSSSPEEVAAAGAARLKARKVAELLRAEQADDEEWEGNSDEEGGAAFGVERWLLLREVLCEVALMQGRKRDCLGHSGAGQKEASVVGEVRCRRRLALLGCFALARMGQLKEAERECSSSNVLEAMVKDHLKGGAMDFAKACAFMAGLRRERAVGATSPAEAQALLEESSALLESATTALAKRARSCGFLGVGPLTFATASADADSGGAGGGGVAGDGTGEGSPSLTVTTPGAPSLGSDGPSLGEKDEKTGNSSGGGGGGGLITNNVMGGGNNSDSHDLVAPLASALLQGSAVAEACSIGPNASLRKSLPSECALMVDTTDVTAQTPLSNLYLEEVLLMAHLFCARAELALDLPFTSPSSSSSSSSSSSTSSSSSASSVASSYSTSDQAPTSGGELRTALRFAHEGLALLRHIACPPPTLRARLLLVVGRLRRRTLQLTPEEVAWAPPSKSSKRHHRRSTRRGGGGGGEAGGDTDGIGNNQDGLENEEDGGGEEENVDDDISDGEEGRQDEGDGADNNATSGKGMVVVPPKDVVCGVPSWHPVGACAGALLGALRVSHERGGHDHALMRDACLELSVLLGGCPLVNAGGKKLAQQHLHMAMKFLVLGAELAHQHRILTGPFQASVPSDLFPHKQQGLPPALVEELLQLPPVGDVTTRSAVGLLLSLKREASADPLGLLRPCTSLLPLLTTLHGALNGACHMYRDTCVVSSSSNNHGTTTTSDGDYGGNKPHHQSECLVINGQPVSGAAPSDLPQDMVVVQWRDCDANPSSSFSATTVDAFSNDGGGAGGGDSSSKVVVGCLRTHKEALVLLGQSASFEEYAESRHLDTVAGVPVEQIRRLQRRAAAFRYALHRVGKDGVDAIPELVVQGWHALLCGVHLTFRPNSANQYVRSGEVRFSNGDPCEISPSLANLSLVEGLLDPSLGAKQPNEPVCAWLRDVFHPLEEAAR